MTEEQRDNILNEMSKNLKKINVVLDEHSKELKKINVVLDEHSKELEKINAILETHTEELTAQRQNMAKMEYNLTEKIMALFDLNDVHRDKFVEDNLRITEIQNTLDWHDRRILKLEMLD